MIALVPATDADIPEVVALSNRAYRDTGPQASWNVESMIAGARTTAAYLREDLAAAPDAQMLLWRGEDGTLTGHVWLQPLADGVWYLGLLAVRPDRQDQKLGRTLLAASEDFARARGGTRIRMTVIHQRETLIAWYLRRGYVLTGETEPFPYGDDRAGAPLSDALYFDVLERAL